MINIQNIHIAFDETLIENGTLTIAPYELTVIKGNSGSGKTSLLYVAGLLSNDKKRQYTFNEHTIENNDQEMALFRKKHVGYVFQENSLIDHLSIYENMRLYSAMIGKEISENEVSTLLESVHLDKDIHQEITTLSGGERQRLAIACAISKKPELLILDEPTSALDHTNMQTIMDILKELASTGMMILIASHDQDVINQCDVIYEIKNKQLIRNHESSLSNQKIQLQMIHLKPKFYLNYYLNYFKKNFWIHLVMFIMCGFAIATLIGSNTINTSFSSKQLENMDAIGNREIFVTSKQTPDGRAQYKRNLPELNTNFISRIQNNYQCAKVYPFYEAYTENVSINNKTQQMPLIIQPYTPESRLADYIYEGEAVSQGIYISYSLNSALKIGDLISTEIILPNSQTLQLENLKINGVLGNNVINQYSSASDIIYVPIEMLPEPEIIQSILVYSTHFDTTGSLVDEIRKLDKNIGVFNRYSRTQYLSEAFQLMQSFAPMIIGMIVIITSVLVFLIYSRYIGNRKKKFAY